MSDEVLIRTMWSYDGGITYMIQCQRCPHWYTQDHLYGNGYCLDCQKYIEFQKEIKEALQ